MSTIEINLPEIPIITIKDSQGRVLISEEPIILEYLLSKAQEGVTEEDRTNPSFVHAWLTKYVTLINQMVRVEGARITQTQAHMIAVRVGEVMKDLKKN